MIYLKDEEIDAYVKRYVDRLSEKGLSEEEIDLRVTSHLQNNVVIKYSKEYQDMVWNNLMDTWNQPGGYWVLQDYLKMQHVEFEHYKQKNRRSYEKGNVPKDMAKKELNPKYFEAYSVHKGFTLTTIDDTTELEVDCEVELKLVNGE